MIGLHSICKISQRPYVDAEVQGHKTRFLYDSGAEVTVISEKEFRKIPIEKRPERIHRQVKLSGVAQNKPLEIKGVYKMHLSVLGRKRELPVFVIKNLTQDCILGIDAIKSFGLCFNATKNEVYFEKSDTFELSPLCINKAILLKPFEVCSISFNIPTELQEQDKGVVHIKSRQHPLLQGAEGIISLKNKTGFCVIKNCSPLPVTLNRGECVGVIENISGLSEKEILVQEISEKSKPVPPLKEDREKEIKMKLKMNVPEDYLEAYQKLVLKYHDVFSKDKYDLGRARNFTHKIHLKNNDPVFVKQFKIPDMHHDLIKEQIHEWLKMGIIERCNSPYNSSVFLVPKKNGGLRIVQDFRALNANSHQDRYNLKDVSECIGEIGRAGSVIFSTFDMSSGFHQMTLDKKSRPYTAFTIPGLGQFQFCVSAMGLASSPSQFQRCMEMMFQGLEDILVIYIDDVILHARTHDDHLKNLEKFFQRVREVNMKLNLEKSTIGAQEVNYLGFRLTPKGILPGLDKLKAVKDFPPPADPREIKQFMGLCNFFRTHIRNFSLIAQPLNKLTRKECEWKGGKLPPDAMNAFIQLKSALLTEPIVDFPRRNRPYSLIVDAASGDKEKDGGLGAILCQTNELGEMKVIAYASRGLQKHEKKITPVTYWKCKQPAGPYHILTPT